MNSSILMHEGGAAASAIARQNAVGLSSAESMLRHTEIGAGPEKTGMLPGAAGGRSTALHPGEGTPRTPVDDANEDALPWPVVPPLDPQGLVAWLVVAYADDRPLGLLIPLQSALWTRGEFIIGRESGDIKFANKALSKVHLRITYGNAQSFVVEDLGSTNGSFLAPNCQSAFEQLQGSHPLADGNVLRLGDIVLVFRCYRTTAQP